MQVEFKVNGEELNAVPTGKAVERTSEVHAIEQPFDEEFKKQFTRKREPERDGMKNVLVLVEIGNDCKRINYTTKKEITSTWLYDNRVR